MPTFVQADPVQDKPVAPGEGASELDAIAAQADALEAGAAGQPGQTAVANLPEGCTAADVVPLLKMARAGLAPSFNWWPDYASTWDDQQLQMIGQASADAMNHYGLSLGAVLGHPLVAVALAVIPPSFATYAATKHHKAQIAARHRQGAHMPASAAEPAP